MGEAPTRVVEDTEIYSRSTITYGLNIEIGSDQETRGPRTGWTEKMNLQSIRRI